MENKFNVNPTCSPMISLRKLPDVCRICLSVAVYGDPDETTNVELYPIDDIYVQRSSLAEHIASFRDILTVFVNDEMKTNGGMLPSIICLNCARRAEEAYEFVEQCRRTDQLLELHFATSACTTEIDNTANEVSTEVIAEVQQRKKRLQEPTKSSKSSELQKYPDKIELNDDEKVNLEMKHTKKRFFCDKCNKSFSQSQTIRRHYRMHDRTGSNIKPCTFCSKTFLRSDDLARHVRTHTGERPYKCSVCPKAYKQWSELNEHSLTHARNKLYKCEECFKELSTRNGFYVHMKVHRGEKRFMCPHCSKRFTTSSELISHTRRIHSEMISDTKDVHTR